VGKIPVNIDELDVDLLSMSAHKLYGPKEIGALFIRGGSSAIAMEPIWYGGGQENGLRSGTMNVPSIIGFGEACNICQTELLEEAPRIRTMRDRLESELLISVSSLKINGALADRLPNTSSLIFQGVDADALILNSPEIMVGTGSACTSGAIEPSHVLMAIGLNREEAGSTIRISLGRFTMPDQIGKAVSAINLAYIKLQN
jgi:cysteine desulfurase